MIDKDRIKQMIESSPTRREEHVTAILRRAEARVALHSQSRRQREVERATEEYPRPKRA